MGFIKERLINFSHNLKGKQIIFTSTFRLFCDGGQPRFKWYPTFVKSAYDPYWNISGFRMYLWGREYNFSFGKDVKGLYRQSK